MDETYNLPEFDTIRIKTFIEEQTNIGIITYIITIVLYIISFYFLFKNNSTEYITWIMLFILNFVTPLLWIGDMAKLFNVVNAQSPSSFNKTMFAYGFGSLVIAGLLTFISIFMVLLKNEDVRQIKKKQGHYKDTSEMPDLKTNIREVEKNDRDISILYTTIVSLVWGMIAFNFGEYLQNTNDIKNKYPFGSRVKALMDIVPDILTWIDRTIHYYTKQLPLSPMLKTMIFYAVTFIAVFFGIFTKIDYSIGNYGVGLKENVEFVNMQPMFTSRFDKEFYRIRHFVIFLVAFFTIVMFAELMFMTTRSTSKIIIYVLTAIVGGIMTPIYYMKQEEWFSKSMVKHIAFFFSCVLFGLVGAAPIIGIYELLMSFFRSPGLDMFGISFIGETSKTLYYLMSSLLVAIIFLLGVSERWVDKDGEAMKTFLVFLVTMTISLFIGLSTEMSMFKGLYDIIALFLRVVMKFIAPITIVVLSFMLILFSHRNYKIIKNRANDKIVEKREATDTPQKTKDVIADQKKVRNMLKNTYNDFVGYFDVNDRVNAIKDIFSF